VGHVPAHRFADAAAGRLSARQLNKLNAHTDTCAKCSAARERVAAASGAFADIREQEGPELHWEHIGARVYWATSSEQRAASRSQQMATTSRPRRLWFGIAGGSVVVAAGAVLLFMSMNGKSEMTNQAVAPTVAPTPATVVKVVKRAVPKVVPAATRAVTGVVTFAKGDVRLDGSNLGFDAPLRAGHTLTTKRGSVAVQFDSSSGFLVAPNSAVELRSFDSRKVELVVTGSVSVNITKRAPGQYFAVVAGDRRVEVRGTAFEVNFRAGRLAVSCVRGHVVVADAKGAVDVRAGQTLKLADSDLLAGMSAATLRGGELSSVSKRAEFHMLPAWADASAMLATSSTLRVAADPGGIVKVDGKARGTGKFALRMMSGRHHVASNNSSKGKWVDLHAGKTGRARIASGVSGLRAARALRTKQLRASLRGVARLRRCLRKMEKQGMPTKGVFIEFDIGIASNGSKRHLNVLRTNAASASGCMRQIVQQVSFPKGPAATIRYRAAF